MKLNGLYNKSLYTGEDSFLTQFEDQSQRIPLASVRRVRINQWATCSYRDVELWGENGILYKLTYKEILAAKLAQKQIQEVVYRNRPSKTLDGNLEALTGS